LNIEMAIVRVRFKALTGADRVAIYRIGSAQQLGDRHETLGQQTLSWSCDH
jgi:hypothetical protein